jgi:DNA-directed RNA polymerase specialized sigma subunit
VRKQKRIAKGSLWNRAEGSYAAEMEQGDEDADENLPGIAKDPMPEIHDYVYHDLDDIDKQVFQHRLGYRGSQVLPNQEIAKKLNLSSAAVTQRAGRIQKRLEETMKWV